MINALVTYTVKPEFVAENKSNIRKFMKDFQKLDHSRFVYNVFVKDDGVTFVHISNYQDATMQQQLLNAPSFLEFQAKRDASGLNDSHSVSIMDYVDASKPIL